VELLLGLERVADIRTLITDVAPVRAF